MSHRRDMKRAAAGGYPAQIADSDPVTVALERVRSLLRIWQLFGIGDEDTAISELQRALGDRTPTSPGESTR